MIPAYNERETIGSVIDDWYPIIEKHHGDGQSRLVIIDDGSKDDTYEIIQKHAKTHPLLVPLTKSNSGHGSTLLFGYQYAIEHGADFVFQTDSDGQTLASEFSPFWEKREQYVAIIGHRSQRQDGLLRVLVTKVLQLVLLCIFGVMIPDANTPFRLMHGKVLCKYLSWIPDNFNLSNVLLTVLLMKGKEKVLFLPITFRTRQGGVNSINVKRIIEIGKQAIRDFIHMRRELM